MLEPINKNHGLNKFSSLPLIKQRNITLHIKIYQEFSYSTNTGGLQRYYVCFFYVSFFAGIIIFVIVLINVITFIIASNTIICRLLVF